MDHIVVPAIIRANYCSLYTWHCIWVPLCTLCVVSVYVQDSLEGLIVHIWLVLVQWKGILAIARDFQRVVMRRRISSWLNANQLVVA